MPPTVPGSNAHHPATTALEQAEVQLHDNNYCYKVESYMATQEFLRTGSATVHLL